MGSRPTEIAPRPSAEGSMLRAWLFLVWLSWQRQARARQMVWIALALLALAATGVAVHSYARGWGLDNRTVPRRPEGPGNDRPPVGMEDRFRPGGPPPAGAREAVRQALHAYRSAPITYKSILSDAVTVSSVAPADHGVPNAILAAAWAIIERSDFQTFSRAVVLAIFVSFLLPLWSLAFATESLGGERESRSLVWLLTRPLPRPAIYLGKFVALIPWSVGLTLGGFVVLCLAADWPAWAGLANRPVLPGVTALRLYWPAVVWGTLAFSALFYLFGAYFRRPAVLAIVYAFFLETILGNMPGYLKRVSISFYVRCMMFDAAEVQGVQPERPLVYLPVDGTTAWLVLMGVTAGLLALGMLVFSRLEYTTGD